MSLDDCSAIVVHRDGLIVGSVPLEECWDFEYQDGDRLQVISNVLQIVNTYDGCFQVRLESGDTLRIPRIWNSYTFGDYQIPAHLLHATGSNFENFESSGNYHVNTLKRFLALDESHDVLEIGCGVGKTALQMMSPRQVSSYLGIDVIKESIDWCTRNLTNRDTRFRFEHFDAHHEMYNPLGDKKTTDFAIPSENSSFDRVFLYSVFTHLFEEDISHYLREISRVLRPGGLVYATVFLYTDEVLASVRMGGRFYDNQTLSPQGANNIHLTFEFQYSEGCYVDDANQPLGSIAYTREAMDKMIRESGLVLVGDYLPIIARGWTHGMVLKPYCDTAP